jgi:hypothetical protein
MKENRDEKQVIIDFQQTFGTESGKRVLANLRHHSKIDGYLNVMKGMTPIQMAFAEGQRSMMMHIYTKLGKDPYEVRQARALNFERKEDG